MIYNNSYILVENIVHLSISPYYRTKVSAREFLGVLVARCDGSGRWNLWSGHCSLSSEGDRTDVWGHWTGE